jgi:SNF2 family DNA or RNA helicase
LPDKITNDIYCDLSKQQVSLYKEILDSSMDEVDANEGIKRKGLVLKLITSLKQVCNHPSQYSKSKKYNVDDSGKMQALMNILENILESNEKVLIFTQYVQMGNIMKKLVEDKFNEEVLFLHGSLSRKKRDELVKRFQKNTQSKIFIISLKAGGTGLNLTAASNVIHYDLWWNPAVENQATDRAYRIGQKDNVMVYRFITKGTFEEKINQMIHDKEELAQLTVGSGEQFITEMSDGELREMFNLRRS